VSKLAKKHATDIDFAAALQAVNIPLHIIGPDERLLFGNPAWERHLGLRVDEVIGLHINDILKNTNIEYYFAIETTENGNVERVLHFEEKIYGSVALTALKLGKSVSMFVYDPDRSETMVNSTPIFKDGKIQCVLTTCLNMKRSVEYREQMLEIAHQNKIITEELDMYRKQYMSEGLIGDSKAVRELRKIIEDTAKTDATILITGESGVGKEVLANEIHRLSARGSKPLVKINCASIPATLIESELFGYERGAFTGAVKSKMGMFEMAHGGTILLDEIGELSKSLQPKLLRVIQEREILRIGGTAGIPVNVRIIAATNQNLSEMVAKGDFRKDLYYRLNLIPIRIPPLRERKEDIPLLSAYYLRKFNTKHLKNKTLTEEAMEALIAHSWPGNVRELENLLERLVIIGNDAEISSFRITSILQDVQSPGLLEAENGDAPSSLKKMVSQYEQNILQSALKSCGSTYAAARALNSSQGTIARKAKQYKLVW
jgi:transcriptional regulator with PAS, ATPase and Fis domain